MSEEVTCWICGRGVTEIAAAMSGESELRKSIDDAKKAREDFARMSEGWKKEVPDAFKQFDLAFILQNADQFRSIPFVDRLAEFGRKVVVELDDASYKARRNEAFSFGIVPQPQSSRDLVIARLDAFEERTKRRLKREEDMRDPNQLRLGYIAGLMGLKLPDGVNYLGEVWLFYYDLQLELLERARVDAGKRKPSWKIGSVKVAELSKEIPVCSVCEGLVKALHTAGS